MHLISIVARQRCDGWSIEYQRSANEEGSEERYHVKPWTHRLINSTQVGYLQQNPRLIGDSLNQRFDSENFDKYFVEIL
jgi:hypothetical protein